MCCHGNQNHEVWMAVHLNCQLFQGGTENWEIMNEAHSDPLVSGWNKGNNRKKYCLDIQDKQIFLSGKQRFILTSWWQEPRQVVCPLEKKSIQLAQVNKILEVLVQRASWNSSFSPGVFTFISCIKTSLILYQSNRLACTLKLSVSWMSNVWLYNSVGSVSGGGGFSLIWTI